MYQKHSRSQEKGKKQSLRLLEKRTQIKKLLSWREDPCNEGGNSMSNVLKKEAATGACIFGNDLLCWGIYKKKKDSSPPRKRSKGIQSLNEYLYISQSAKKIKIFIFKRLLRRRGNPYNKGEYYV